MGGFWVVAGRPSRCRLLVVSVAVLAMVSSLGAVSSAQAAVVKSILAGAVAVPAVTRIQTVAAAEPIQLPSDWLAQVNGYRQNYGVPEVVEDSALSAADALHVNWMAVNKTMMHGEIPGTPSYTVAGDQAGASSNLFMGSTDPIRGWMTAPFHALGILRPTLQSTGYAFNPEGNWAALDVISRNNGPAPATTSFPMTWPTSRGPVDLVSYDGGESPDPVAGCGLASSSGWGVPLIASFGYYRDVRVQSAELHTSTGHVVPVCLRDASSYPGVGSAILGEWGTVLVIPRERLSWDTHYTGSVTTDAGIAILDFSTAPAAARPGAPVIGTATAGNASATVKWTAPADGGSAITGYGVRVVDAVTNLQVGVLRPAVAGATSMDVTGLVNGTAVRFQVQAANRVDAGAFSALSAAVTPATTVPSAPVIATATPGDASATVGWTAPADGGSAITGYGVRVVDAVTNVQVGVLRPAVAGATSLDVTGLVNGTAVRFQVQAANTVGMGAFSALSAAVTPATAPSAPAIGTATAGNASAMVTWTAPVSDGGSLITGYAVTAVPGGGTVTVFGSTTSATITGLSNGTAYTFTVTAINVVGPSPASVASAAVTPKVLVTAPGAPTGVVAIPGDAQALVSWTTPAGGGGSPITGYTITATPGGGSATTTGATTAAITGLSNGTAYTFTVTATNALGTSPASSSSAAVTPKVLVTAPGAPTGVVAIPGDAQALVSWTTPAGGGGSPITGYTITATPGGGSATTTGATTATITGLSNGTAYTFTVTATNAAGTSPASVASAAVTPKVPVTAPGAPTGAAAIPGNAQAVVSWNAPASDGGSLITGYTVTAVPGGGTITVFGSTTSATITELSNGTAYTFTVTAINLYGISPSSVASAAVTPKAPAAIPSKVSLSVTSRAYVGAAITASTTVTDQYGVAKANWTVTLQKMQSGTSTWKPVKSLTTTAAGAASYRFANGPSGYYRWVTAAVTGAPSKVSPSVKVTSTARVVERRPATSMTRGRYLKVSGSLSSVRSPVVYIQYRYAGGAWRTGPRATVRGTAISGRIKLTGKRTAYTRLYVKSATSYLGSVSRSYSTKVR